MSIRQRPLFVRQAERCVSLKRRCYVVCTCGACFQRFKVSPLRCFRVSKFQYKCKHPRCLFHALCACFKVSKFQYKCKHPRCLFHALCACFKVSKFQYKFSILRCLVHAPIALVSKFHRTCSAVSRDGIMLCTPVA